MGENVKSIYSREPDRGSIWICPDCETENYENREYCEACGCGKSTLYAETFVPYEDFIAEPADNRPFADPPAYSSGYTSEYSSGYTPAYTSGSGYIFTPSTGDSPKPAAASSAPVNNWKKLDAEDKTAVEEEKPKGCGTLMLMLILAAVIISIVLTRL